MNALMVYFEDVPYAQEADSAPTAFASSLYAELLDADIGFALTSDGQSIQEVHAKQVKDALENVEHPTKFSSGYRREYCLTDEDRLTPRVRLYSGETVRVNDYDVVLISHLISHLPYTVYLAENFPGVTFVGVQEESLQDVQLFPADLQMLHYEALKAVDGFISEDPTYATWVSGIVDSVLQLPLLVPENQFDDVSPVSESRNAVCIGIGTYNLDPANIYSNLVVYRRLREAGFQLSAEFIGAMDFQKPMLEGYAEVFEDVEILGYLEDEFYSYLSGLDLAILLTERISAGRVSAELAAVGIPCIGNKQNDLQRRCFPELSVGPHETTKAIELAERLLTDEKFRQSTIMRAQSELRRLEDHEQSQQKIRTFISDLS